MLSMILSHANSNEVSFAGLKHVAVAELRLGIRLLAVDSYPALVDEAPGIAPALGKTGLDDRRNEVRRILGRELAHLFGRFALAKPGVELGLRFAGFVVAVQPLDE